jgi:Fe/S biogenesis protein NfuA
MAGDVLTVTNGARDKMKSILEERGLEEVAIRITVLEGAAYRYQLQFVPQADSNPTDSIVDLGDLRVYIDEESVPRIKDATLDFVDDASGSGFSFENPNTPRLMQDPLARRVHQLIEERIAPGLAGHGGFVTLVDVADGKVYLQFGGGCQGCGMVDSTLKDGIAKALKEELPEITDVLDATDHSAGSDPYYRGGGG